MENVKTKPNEYGIQTSSSVYETLSEMPDFFYELPDAVEQKSRLFYDLWGRPTLEYSANCDKSIEDAIQVLDELDGLFDTEGLNMTVWILSASFAGCAFIYMLINCWCHVRVYKGSTGCCAEKTCYRANMIIYSSLLFLIAILILVMESINYNNQTGKSNSIISWSEYSSCVDTYM